VNRTIPITALPAVLRVEDAVEAACAADIAFIEERLRRGVSVLVECDKELSLYLYLAVRQRLRARRARRDSSWSTAAPPPRAAAHRPLAHDRAAHRDRARIPRRTVIVLLHLDVLTTTHTGLTLEAREAIPSSTRTPRPSSWAFATRASRCPR
jgi:hypothetical protein